jgi:hypothetical protein
VKVLAVNSARSIWLVPTVLLNPTGRYLAPIFEKFAARYQFARVPDSKEISVSPLSLKFQDGVFTSETGTQIYASLSVHDDGLVAETRASTEESDKLLAEALDWFSTEFGLPHYSELGVKRIYASELVIQTKLSMSIFNDEFLEFTERMRKGISREPGQPLDITALHFAVDPSVTKTQLSFRIERLANTPFKENRYYSAAPLPTSEHVSLLKLLTKATEHSHRDN